MSHSESTSDLSPANKAGSSLLTVDDVAARLQVHKNTIYEYVKSGVMPSPMRLSGQLRWSPHAIEEWIEARMPNISSIGSDPVTDRTANIGGIGSESGKEGEA